MAPPDANSVDRPLSIERIRAELSARLRERAPEIEQAIFDRIQAVSEPGESSDAEYVGGLREVVKKTLDFSITSIERGGEWGPEPPAAVAMQAQRAARTGVSLDTVLRRYAAGDRIVGEFIVEEADKFSGQIVGQVLKTRGPLVDRLMSHAATQYMREMERMTRSSEQRRAELVERLLADDITVDRTELDYEFDAWHLAAVFTGEGAEAAAGRAAGELGRPALIVPRGPRTVWAWFGGRHRLGFGDIEGLLDGKPSAGVSLAVGEAGHGVRGWRLSHQEAQAGYQIMLRKPQRLVRGTDVLLLAAMMRDGALARSLLQTYLAPLDIGSGDTGTVLRDTLRAYFASGRNAATAAAALEVDRHTVQRRLRKVEELLGRLLDDCYVVLEVGLGLEEIDSQEPLLPTPPALTGQSA
jgi:hypothetical protein